MPNHPALCILFADAIAGERRPIGDLVGSVSGSFGFARTDYLKNYRPNDAYFISLEVNISPFQGKKLAHPQTRAERHQYERSFPKRQRGQ